MAWRYPEQLLYSFLTQEQRFLLACEITEFDRSIRKQNIRRMHPDWCELEVMHEMIRQAFLPEPMPEWLVKQMQQRLDQQHARQSAGLE
jgi:hypothetical protein